MISRNKSLALFLILTIFLACGFLYVLNITQAVKEGFEGSSLENNYKTLQTKLKSTLASYCSLTNFVQDQMKTMFQADKVSDSGGSIPGDSETQATEHINTAYRDAYACKDELASSRQSCSGLNALTQANVKMDFIPCTVYMNTPAYDESDTLSAAIALYDIPDNLALRITKEVDWYASIIKKLQDGIDAGANPPSALPPDAPGADYKASPDQSAPPGAPSKKEGYADIIEGFTLLHEGFASSKFSNIKDKVKSAANKAGSAVVSAAKKTEGAVVYAAKKTGSAVAGAAKKTGSAVVGAAKKTGGAVAGAAKRFKELLLGPAKSKSTQVAGAKCSPEAMRLRQQKMRQKMQEKMAREQMDRQQSLDAESDNCTIPDFQSEIDRVNKILNSDALRSALERCAAVADAAKKLQAQLALLKAGNLYDWQKSGPTKSYAQFKGGDRIAGLTFSIQQNR